MAVRSSARSIRARPVTGYCGARRVISASIVSRCRTTAVDELPGQGGGRRIALLLRQMALQDGLRGPLAEVGLEDRREGEATSGPSSPDPVSPRHRRPGR